MSSKPLPAPLPPETRTVGQVVAEAVRLYGRHPRPLAGPEDGEPLHRLDLDAVRPADARARPDRADERLWARAAHPVEQRPVGEGDRGNERPGRVAVPRLGAEHEGQRSKSARPRDPDLEDRLGPLLRERARGRGRRLDRPDPARERASARNRSWWSYIPHFIGVPGYVYAYAFGFLFSLAIYRRYLEEGESLVEPYLDLLRAGGSAPPAELASRLGFDVADPSFWSAGLDALGALVDEAEQLAAELDA